MIKLKRFFSIVLSSHLILLQVSVALSEGETRVVGGTPTTIKAVPPMVQIYRDGNFHCAGTLIRAQYVLTAAHCLMGIPPESFIVVANASKLYENGIRSRVSKTMTPRGYSPQTMDYDVGVIKLNTRIEGIEPATTCTTTWKHGDPVQLYGWGQKMDYTDNTSVGLYTASVNIVDKNFCSNILGNIMGLTNTMFCATGAGKSSCNGDSGGPVVVNNQICGVVSWGVKCGLTNLPAVYTSIPQSMSFIKMCLQQ